MDNFHEVRFSNNLLIQKFKKNDYLIHQTKTDKRIVVNKTILNIIELFDNNKKYSLNDLMSKINKELDFTLSYDEVKKIILEKLAPLGIVEIKGIEVSKSNPFDYLTIRMILFKASQVKKVSWIFQSFFRPIFFYVSLILMLSFVVFIVYSFLDFDKLIKSITPLNASITSLSIVFSMFFHELGHATACRKFGANHGGIGFGFYMLSPVLFADVSDVWKLDKAKRVIVNLAGFYLQLILCTFFVLLYLLFNYDFAILFTYYTLMAFIVNLNPFFRYDGYWVLSDATGIYNLKPKSIKLFKQTIINLVTKFKLNLKSGKDLFLFLKTKNL